jgi:hypothetical protein
MKKLTLGELIDKIEPLIKKQEEVKKKHNDYANVSFDFCDTVPTGLSSWRGSYAELAIEWSGGHYESREEMNVIDFLEMLKGAIGKSYTGWKGGDFTMDRDTRLWVANSGLSGGTGITDVIDEEYYIRLETSFFEF